MMYSTILHQIQRPAISQLKPYTKVTSFSCDQHHQPTQKIAAKGKYPSGYVCYTLSQLSPKFWLHKVHLLWKVILTMIRALFPRIGRVCRARCVLVACIMKFYIEQNDLKYVWNVPDEVLQALRRQGVAITSFIVHGEKKLSETFFYGG